MSGMRNAPPISTSSPRETTTSLAGGQCAQGEQHGGGVVVHDGGGLGPGELADQVGYQVVAVAAAAGPPGRIPGSLGWSAPGPPPATASCGSRARPRLVCSTVPVRLNTGFRRGAWRRCQRLLHLGGDGRWGGVRGAERATAQLRTQGIEHLAQRRRWRCCGHSRPAVGPRRHREQGINGRDAGRGGHGLRQRGWKSRGGKGSIRPSAPPVSACSWASATYSSGLALAR